MYHYFTNTKKPSDWWKRLLAIIIIPLIHLLFLFTTLILFFSFIPISFIYWIITNKSFKLTLATKHLYFLFFNKHYKTPKPRNKQE